MLKKPSMFRQSALDRLSSPDQLDQLVKVTSPTGWLALSGCILLLVVAVAWGIEGELPTNVSGTCILMKSGGIQEVTFNGGGRVTDIAVREGDIIEQGQLIARVEQPQLLNELRNLQQRRNDLVSSMTENMSVIDSEGQTIKQRIKVQQTRIDSLVQLVEDGLKTQRELAQARSNLSELEIQLVRLPVRQIELENQLSQLDRTIGSSVKQLNLASGVYSNYSGRIVEVMASDGQLVSPGVRLLNMEPSGLSIKNLEVIMYVPAGAGKMVKPGMSAKISPSTVKREEYGTLIATVKTVSAFPATYNGMMRILRNEQLVRSLSNVSSIQVTADLVPMPDSPENTSGYMWTSPAGPPVIVEPGTICAGQITTRKQAPIALVIPALRKFLGVY